MGVGSFKIPVEDYYAKSSDFKSKVSELAEAVQGNFLDLVSNNIDTLDSLDALSVGNIAAYSKAKSKLQDLQEHETKLENMSQEGSNNPLQAVVQLDNDYATIFSNISQGEASTEVASELGTLSVAIEDAELTNTVIGFINSVGSAVGDNDWVQRMLQLAKTNPAKALEQLYENEKFLETVFENERVGNFFITTITYLEKAQTIPAKLMNTIFDNSAFIQWADDLSPGNQDRLLNVMIKISDAGYDLLNTGSKWTGWITKLAQGKVGSIANSLINSKAASLLKTGAQKFGESTVGKVIANPWVGLAIETGVNSIFAYNDSSSETYHDVGKSVASGAIDTIANVGPVSGALIGASVAGPIGAVAGFFVGAGIQAVQYFFPDAKSKAKEIAYDAIDNISSAGKAVAAKASDVISTAGAGLSNLASSATSAVAGWFG